MQRIKLTIPQQFIFSCQLPVTINHINYGNHMGNDAFFSFAHEARIQWLQSLGFTELNINGLGIIMLDAAIQYLQQVQHGQQITIRIALKSLVQNGFTLVYFFEALTESESSKKVAIIESNLLFFDYSTQKIAACPAIFAEKVGKTGNSILL
jgi:acyl-CoA thioester hydrolase